MKVSTIFPILAALTLVTGRRVNEEKLQTLHDFLLESPWGYDLHKTFEKRGASGLDCASICGPIPAVDVSQKCAQWAPDTEVKQGCHCVKAYKCCPKKCPTPDPKLCRGKTYPVKETDCCQCPVLKCLACPAVIKRKALCPKTYPAKCYKYKAKGIRNPETKCWEATCEYDPEEPKDEVCDEGCMTSKVQQDECGLDYTTCVPNKVKADCPLDTIQESSAKLTMALNCYEDPKQVPHIKGGKWFEDNACKVCTRWKYAPKSCADKDAAAEAKDCHKHGHEKLDESCWEKSITQDGCKCKMADCVASKEGPVTHKFDVKHVCPEGHVKLRGISLCNVDRDICSKCPEVKDPDCEYGTIVKEVDVNGCDVKRCWLPQRPEVECKSELFILDRETGIMTCKPEEDSATDSPPVDQTLPPGTQTPKSGSTLPPPPLPLGR